MEDTQELAYTTDHRITVPLMERRMCGSCDHLHRAVLIRKCECCAADINKFNAELVGIGQNDSHESSEPSDSGSA